jgi:hypothetical protein
VAHDRAEPSPLPDVDGEDTIGGPGATLKIDERRLRFCRTVCEAHEEMGFGDAALALTKYSKMAKDTPEGVLLAG